MKAFVRFERRHRVDELVSTRDVVISFGIGTWMELRAMNVLSRSSCCEADEGQAIVYSTWL